MFLSVAAVPASAEPVPFVRCDADGQTGPIEGPDRGETPDVERSAAQRLAYYRSHSLGVLAPRGWSCFSLYGSSGVVLVVAERSLGSPPLGPGFRVTGNGVVLSQSYGGTSGRFEVARAINRFFPAHRAFARYVADLGMVDDLDEPLLPSDQIARRDESSVSFVTLPHMDGLGTSGRLSPNDNRVVGGVLIVPGEEPDLFQISVRLGRQAQADEDLIVSDFHTSRGSPRPAQR